MKKRINKSKIKIKEKLNKDKTKRNIKKRNKIFLSTKNLTNNKMNYFFETFLIKKIKDITTFLNSIINKNLFKILCFII